MATNHGTSTEVRPQGALLDDSDFLRTLGERTLQQMLEAEMTAHVGAEPYERTDTRTGHRNGYRPRTLRTRVGTLTLLVPQDREGTFSTALFARYQRSEKALVTALMEMYLEGVSTRKVREVTEALCGTSFSKSLVSSLTRKLDAELNGYKLRKTRPCQGAESPASRTGTGPGTPTGSAVGSCGRLLLHSCQGHSRRPDLLALSHRRTNGEKLGLDMRAISLTGNHCAELAAWRNRPLDEATYPYLFVDARYEDIRSGGRVTSQGVLIIGGVREDGKREILAVDVADTESEATYQEQFRQLKARGLSGVELVTSDEHRGLVAAIKRHFQGASHQRCQVHFTRDLMGMVGASKHGELAAGLRIVFTAPTLADARRLAAELADRWRPTHPRVAGQIDDRIEECFACYAFPPSHRQRIRSTMAGSG